MNERIEAITGQVLDELLPYTWVSLGYDGVKEVQYHTAELIIQECIGELAKWKNEPFPFDADLAIKLLSEHFGIKKC